jgi:hypothetical protein
LLDDRAALICGGPVGRACLWIHGTTLEGSLIEVEGRAYPFSAAAPLAEGELMSNETARARNHAEFLRVVAAMPPAQVLELSGQRVDFPPDWPPELNAAVKPIFAGDFNKSAELLAALNTKYPDNYYVCANLAVTSELAGNDAEALRWVEKAMQLKSNAHYGTEWMHAAVLRAKLALAKDPAWLETHTISGIPLGEVPAGFSLTEDTRTIELADVQKALVAHLVPRMLLVKGPDRIVAALLTELARVEARATAVESGVAMLQLAAEHGAANTALLQKEWEGLVSRRKVRNWWHIRGSNAYPLSIGLVVIAGYYVWRWRRSKGAVAQAAS